MSTVTECVTCGGPIARQQRTRAFRYCSVTCRRDAEFHKRRTGTVFDSIKRHYADLGEVAIRRKLDSDVTFTDETIDIAERYLPEPVGLNLVDDLIGSEQLDMLRQGAARAGFQIISHDSPLPSSADIDAAEATGDWSRMLDDALRGMTWQFAHGFKPDLREFGR